MGLFDKLKERFAPPSHTAPHHTGPHHTGSRHPASHDRDPDEVAVERYRYMLKTAPPETIEQAHAEAFAKLTPEQRQQVLAEMSTSVPESERARSTDPRDMARMATRAEMRQPGTMERSLGGRQGPGMGSMIAGTLLASVAGAFIGTAIADALFDDDMFEGDEPEAGEEMAAPEPAEDFGGDFGGEEF
ncbi:hypothetical protein ACQPZA_27820 [Pseudonocardia xinjiangensis]|uniref:hypothetical protein n=1 Tax=Pseudonocardia xinjiangensis TaxID=75289 RepID=UPI003D8CBD43